MLADRRRARYHTHPPSPAAAPTTSSKTGQRCRNPAEASATTCGPNFRTSTDKIRKRTMRPAKIASKKCQKFISKIAAASTNALKERAEESWLEPLAPTGLTTAKKTPSYGPADAVDLSKTLWFDSGTECDKLLMSKLEPREG